MNLCFNRHLSKKASIFNAFRSSIGNPWLVTLSAVVCYLLLPETVLAQATEPWEGAYTNKAFAGGEIREVYCDLVGLMEGSLGALLASAAAVLALASAAFGDARHGTTLIVCAIGTATISVGVSLYFGDFGCGAQGTPLPATGGPMGGLIGGVDPATVARTAPGLRDAEIAIARGETAEMSFAAPAVDETATGGEDPFDHDFDETGDQF